MAKQESKKKLLAGIFAQLSVIVTLLIFLIVLTVVKNNQTIAEQWSRTAGRFHIAFFGVLNENIPFSITEVIITILLVYSICLLVSFILQLVKKQGFKAISRILSIGVIWANVLCAYTYSVEFAYNRAPLDIELYEGQVKKENFTAISTYFIEDFQYCSTQLTYKENGDIKMPYTKSELNKILHDEYTKIDSSYFGNYTPTIKPMFYSFLYSAFGISGWYFGPFGEGVVNVDSSNAELPFCYAHEMAHGKGVMREDDAQMMAALICLSSDDPYLRYSGYINTYGSALALASYSNNKDDYSTVMNKIGNPIRKNLNYIYNNWKELGVVRKIGDWLNNLYLQMSGDKDGTGSYEDSKPEFDDAGNVVFLSRYQKLFVRLFIERFPSVEI